MELTEEQRVTAYEMVQSGQSRTAVAEELGVHRSTITRIVSRFEAASALRHSSEAFARNYEHEQINNEDTDEELIDENVKLQKKVHRLQDVQRLERKAFREHARVDNVIRELHESMKKTLDKNKFSDTILHTYETGASPVGVVQLSDIHFNELVDDLQGNKFNFEIASKRLHKLIRKAKPLFKAAGVKEVCLFMTGDFLAGDSYDIVIHNMLTYLFKGAKGVNFIPVMNPLECVVGIGVNNILLLHGHLHKGIARNPETEVEKIKARYATQGTLVSYVLMGHIHCAQVSDLYARSSGLPGSNAYSERALNLVGRASQNVYLVSPMTFGEIDGIKVDLQVVDKEPMYNFDNTLASYKKKAQKGTYLINQIII